MGWVCLGSILCRNRNQKLRVAIIKSTFDIKGRCMLWMGEIDSQPLLLLLSSVFWPWLKSEPSCLPLLGTSLFGLSPFGGSHEHHWCPSPVSALTPELDLPDVKCQFFDDHADLTQDYHHQQQHLEDHPHPSHYVSQLTPPSDRGALSVCEQSGSGNITTTASVYLDLDYSNFVERKVFDIENMETRSGLNANRGCESGNNSVFNFGPYDNQWQRPACLPARKSLPYNTRSSSGKQKSLSFFFRKVSFIVLIHFLSFFPTYLCFSILY